MLKIYNAEILDGNIILNDYIDFRYGKFNTGKKGFGEVLGGDPLYCPQRANYNFMSLKDFENYIKTVKVNNGVAQNFVIKGKSYEDLEKEYKDVPKDAKSYRKFNLTEEGIILFTDNIIVKYDTNDLVNKIFGKYLESGMYLLKPGASITMSSPYGLAIKDEYEVLQSKNLGKRLVLQKMERNI